MRSVGHARTRIRSVRALSGLRDLDHLVISNTLVRDVTPLERLYLSTYLDATGSNVSDYSPLAHMVDLEVERTVSLVEGMEIEPEDDD